jgi:hypothetical protein
MKHNSILHMVMLVGLLIGFTCAAESFRDDFSSTENLRAIDNITRVRDYPRIVTHPDVRINRLDANEYRDSKTNKTIGFGWFPSILRLANGDLLCFHREGREHGMKAYEARATVTRSTDGGRTWQAAQIIMQEKDWAIGPMFSGLASDGGIYLNIRKRKIRGEGMGWKWALLHSADNGHTWQQVSDRYGMFANDELSNGEQIWTNWTKLDEWTWTRSTFISKLVEGKLQFGEERKHHEISPSSDEWDFTETNTPGELVCMMREQLQSTYYRTARSLDYGKTWTRSRDSNVYLGQTPTRPRIHTMNDGRLIFSYGQRDIGRTFVVASKDKGKTWDIDHRQVILHSPRQYHHFWDSHYTDAAWAEGDKWIAIDYIASPKDRKLRGIYGTFIDTRYFDDRFKGVAIKQLSVPATGKAVGFWRFDQTDSKFARDSEHSHYGEIHGAKRVPGRFGGALQFDGKDDHVIVYDEATLWVENHFAMEVWIKTRDASKEQVIISKGSKYTLSLLNGKPVLKVGNGEASADMKKPLENNRWYHLLVIHTNRDGYTKVMFFIDGKQVSYMRPKGDSGDALDRDTDTAISLTDMKITGGPMFQQTHGKNRNIDNLVFGMDNILKGDRAFDGWIDEVVIYRKGLTYAQATDRMVRHTLPRATVSSLAITKPKQAKWTAFKAKTTIRAKTAVAFNILNTQGKVLLNNIASGADLGSITDEAIVLKAELTTTADGQSPVLHEWSVNTSSGTPVIIEQPFPNQTSLPAEPAVVDVVEKPKAKVALPDMDPNAIRIKPVKGIPANLYLVPLGTKKSIVFTIKQDPKNIAAAWLVISADDIDEPKEAKITLNNKHAIKVHPSVLGESIGHRGAMIVPVKGLLKGRNTFEFVFADNLGGTTDGYSILKAELAISLSEQKELPL